MSDAEQQHRPPAEAIRERTIDELRRSPGPAGTRRASAGRRRLADAEIRGQRRQRRQIEIGRHRTQGDQRGQQGGDGGWLGLSMGDAARGEYPGWGRRALIGGARRRNQRNVPGRSWPLRTGSADEDGAESNRAGLRDHGQQAGRGPEALDGGRRVRPLAEGLHVQPPGAQCAALGGISAARCWRRRSSMPMRISLSCGATAAAARWSGCCMPITLMAIIPC